jgi:hypothetical protein
MDSVLPFVGLAVFLAVALRVAACRWDRGRIEHYIVRLGGHVLDSRWFPAGPDSFGDESACIYAVRYLDSDGNEHAAHCQASIWTRAVRLVEDRIVHYSDPPIIREGKPESVAKTENRHPLEELALAPRR